MSLRHAMLTRLCFLTLSIKQFVYIDSNKYATRISLVAGSSIKVPTAAT